jgi:D-alanine transaminase
MPEIAYVNGEFVPLDRAMVHVEDRGFQFADAVYEVIRTYHGRPFALEEHLQRLFRSLAAIELPHSFTTGQLARLVDEAIKRAGFSESVVYLQVTRGRAQRHRGFPSSVAPTLVITVRAWDPPAADLLESGIAVISLPDNRWGRCDIKSVALLANVLAYQRARAAGARDAIFLQPDGTITESTAGNVFVARQGRLLTPPLGARLLAGITRAKLLEIARRLSLPCAEQPVEIAAARAADEVFLTSTTVEVVPVVMIDGQTIGTGRPGPLTARLREQFLELTAPR